MTIMTRAQAALLVAGIAGCGMLGKGSSLGVDGAGEGVKTIVSNRSLNVSSSLQIPLEGLLLGAAVYWYVDPLAPNWQVEERKMSEGRYRIALRRKPITTGGDGEAEKIFLRRADQLARDLGRTGFTVVQFETGIESAIPFAYRIASGVIELR
jgi:hypothetical protein